MVYSQKKRRDLAIYRGSSNELITHITSILGVRLKGYINCKKSLEMQCGVFPERERREFPIEKKKIKKKFFKLYHRLGISTKTKTKTPLK